MQTKFIRKSLVLLLGLTLVAGSFGCGNKKADGLNEATVDIAAEQLIDKVYENTDAELYNSTVTTMPIDIANKDEMKHHFGVEELTGLESAAVSEPMISPIAHSVIALKFDNADDANAAAESLMQTAPIRKWVCVEPEAITTRVVYNTYVIFSMSSVDFINNLNDMTIK